MNAVIAWQDEVNSRLVEHPEYAEAFADIENARDEVVEAASG